MSDIAIRCEDLSKRYRIGKRKESYRTLRDTLAKAVATPLSALRPAIRRSLATARRNGVQDLWALKDISFEVKRGEVLGIIGRNGAGKSTLLKILSRITEPSGGYADIHGRIASLLEVGTGFHPELTGRENIFLNGAILGMRRTEIVSNFDEIVSFAGVEKFIDTPVKYYSSGMYLRLAFSVAAHLEPEILLIDEVLAVGDLAFQRKCLGKMEDVAAHGRTVLFVSHNLGAVKELCRTSIVLQDGLLDFLGPVVEGVARYCQGSVSGEIESASANRGNRWREVRINGHRCAAPPAAASTEPFSVEAVLDVQDTFVDARFKCQIDDAAGNMIVSHITDSKELETAELRAGLYRVKVEFPPLWLEPGIYTLHFKIRGQKPSGEEERYKSERVMINVTGRLDGKGQAFLAPPLSWSLSHEVNANA